MKDLTDFLKPVIKSLLVMSGCLSKKVASNRAESVIVKIIPEKKDETKKAN